MRSTLYARTLKRWNREVETELKDLLARSEDVLKVEKAVVVDLKKRNVSLVKELEEAKEGLKERAASKKNRDELKDIVSHNIDLRTQLNEAVRAREAAEEERQKAETRANARAARIVRMGEKLRDCMGAAKVALDSVLTGVGTIERAALPEADTKAFGAWLSEEMGSLKVVTRVVGDYGGGGVQVARLNEAPRISEMSETLGELREKFGALEKKHNSLESVIALSDAQHKERYSALENRLKEAITQLTSSLKSSQVRVTELEQEVGGLRSISEAARAARY